MTILIRAFAPDLAAVADVLGGTVHERAPETKASETQPEITPAIADDIDLYLRHVEGGESIRAIARSAGCHASTILRRIRRFEQRRDDPLVDNAVSQQELCSPPRPLPQRVDRRSQDQTRRILRRLAEPGAELIVSPAMEKALVSRGDIRTAILSRDLAEQFALNDWIELIAQGNRMLRYRLSVAGRAHLRQISSASGAMPQARDFADAQPVEPLPDDIQQTPADHGPVEAEQHRVWADRTLEDPDDGKRRRMRVNLAESPLLLLARRRDPDGQPFLSQDLVSAGERLREDFELASMGPRIGQNWDRFLTAGIDDQMSADRGGGGSEKARARVAEALRELGPGMGDLVLRVCCFLEGLEMTERRLGWSSRSGKIVLKLALERLSRHYTARYGAGGPLIG